MYALPDTLVNLRNYFPDKLFLRDDAALDGDGDGDIVDRSGFTLRDNLFTFLQYRGKFITC